ncbi:MAG: helix-turn-helix domain-containing protein [Oleispira sp.]|nr:helix-turn-helix domain-containing protein [Oleispira sp.]
MKIIPMESFGARLKKALKNAGMTQKELADKIGITQQSVQRSCAPKAIGSTYSLQMANTLDVDAGWLSHGVGDMQPKKALYGSLQRPTAGDQFLLATGAAKIEWSDITNEAIRRTSPRISCPTHHSENTYAVIFDNDNMTAMHGPCYPRGSTLFVDPNRASEAKTGSRVLATIENETGEEIVVFKELREEDGRRYLRALNTSAQRPHITQPFTVIGLVIGTWMSE